MIRTFIAIEPPDRAINQIWDVVSSSKRSVSEKVNWVLREQLHLTLLFLGDTKENDLQDIYSIVSEVISKNQGKHLLKKIHLDLHDKKNPRIVWLSGELQDNLLESVIQKIKREIMVLGYKFENRRFTPHITLGRIKSGLSLTSQYNLLSQPVSVDDFEMNKIVVYKSELNPAGPRYYNLYEQLTDKTN
ncbi:MAG: RNA 2',3'-cyclic phosphodiesterase [Candidatus Cloacimonetes bacterium]|nr:RNA 2',3'-cyclic phosphodiesterase [Candidatus Cloacimonadota bacterium]